MDKVDVFSQREGLGVDSGDVVLVWELAIVYTNVVVSMLYFAVVVLVTFKPLTRINRFILKFIRSGINIIMVVSALQ